MSESTGFRDDIQALRGIAVGLVVLDHFSLDPFAHGYLGVDIFFVISGFLITGIIAREIEAGQFSFRAFYFRRARRILPAALATVAAVTILALWFLNAHEMRSLNAQVAGAATFTINVVLWHRVDYFAVDAASMPLLHYWSLAVEEQFYILFPLLLWLLVRRWWTAAIAGLAVASFAVCLVWGRHDPTGAFYLLPTRAWELLIGALGALVFARTRPFAGVLRWFTGPALITLLVVPSVSTGLPHPGLDALLVCLATLIVLLAPAPWWARLAPARPLVWLGNMSYSLYLVHWPVAVFMTSAILREITLGDRLVGLAVSLFAAVALYLLVERPCRDGIRVLSPRFVGTMTAVSALVVAMQYGAQAYTQHQNGFLDVRRNNYGLARSCALRATVPPASACMTNEKPRTLVWGDSHAMQIVPGLASRLEGGIAQITRTSCGPYLSVSQKFAKRGDAEAWARECMAFNRTVIDYLARSPHITTVVLGSPFRYLLDPDGEVYARGPDGTLRVVPGSVDVAIAGIIETISVLRSLGKRVVVFGSPPLLSSGESNCAERTLTGRISVGLPNGCSASRADVNRRDTSLNALLDRIAREPGVRLMRIADALCNADRCQTIVDGVVIYRDRSHLTYGGSHKVMERLGIGARFE